MFTTAEEFRAGVARERASLLDLLGDLDEHQWKAPTRLPGWTVQDNLSHLTGGAARMVGAPRPDHELAGDLPHLRNDVGRWMEIDVDYRRPRAGAEVLAEFAAHTAALVELLADRESLSVELDGPMGMQIKRGDILSIVMLDWWIHEQDMRDALGRPGHTDGIVVDHGRERMIEALVAQLPGKVPDVVAGGLAIEIDDERRLIGDQDPPALTLTMPVLTAGELCCGRVDIATAGQAVKVQGDPATAATVFAAMCFTP